MTQIVFAKLSIGWQVHTDDPDSSAYLLNGWTLADKSTMKNGSTTDIHSTIPSAYRHLWQSLQMEVNDQGHKPEADVRAFIKSKLDAYNADPDTLWTLTLTETQPQHVTYVYYDDARECLHSYELRWEEKADPTNNSDWVWGHSVTGKGSCEVRVFAMLSWPTPV